MGAAIVTTWQMQSNTARWKLDVYPMRWCSGRGVPDGRWLVLGGGGWLLVTKRWPWPVVCGRWQVGDPMAGRWPNGRQRKKSIAGAPGRAMPVHLGVARRSPERHPKPTATTGRLIPPRFWAQAQQPRQGSILFGPLRLKEKKIITRAI